MNVVHVVNQYTNIDGVYTFLTRFNQALKENNILCHFVARDNPTKHESNTHSDDELSQIHVMSKCGTEEYFREVQPKVIFFHDYVYHDIDLFQIQTDNSRVARVRIIHDIEYFCPMRFHIDGKCCNQILSHDCVINKCISEDIYLSYSKHLAINKKLDGFFCLSPYIKKKLIQYGYCQDRIYQIPAMLSVNERTIRPLNKTILYFGRISEEKGIGELISSLTHLKSTNWKLLIAGTGTPQAVHNLFLSIRRNRLSEYVEYLGYLQRNELHACCLKARVVVVPSIISEAYGYSGAEALSYGIPVVTYNVNRDSGWIVEGKTGIIVPLGDYMAFAQAVDNLLEFDDLYYRLCSGSEFYAKEIFAPLQNARVAEMVMQL